MKTSLSLRVVLSCCVLFVASLARAQTCVVSGVCGDVDASGGVTASDALKVLNRAVGQPLSLTCNCAANTAGAAIDCAGTGQDGEFQAGASHSFVDNGDGTITDEVTGLMWEKLSADGSIHDSSNDYSIADAVAVKIATLNSEQFAGHDDWRLPNRNELATLVNLGTVSPATYAQFNDGCGPGCTATECSCTQNSTHWTSTSQHNSPDYTYYLNFSQGDVGQMQKVPGNTARVRAVRNIP